MSDKEEQEKPLAAGAYRHIDIEPTDAGSDEYMAPRHRKFIKYGGSSAAIFLIIAMVILVLMLTVFHVKDPVLKMNSMNIEGLNSTTKFGPGLNLTVEANVSVENPNVASFKFVNATTSLYYRGSIIGETTSQSGSAQARRTLRMKVLIEGTVVVDEGLKSDLGRRMLPIRLCTRISGNVKITKAIKRSVFLNMNCTMNVNTTSSWRIQDQNCRRL